MLSLVRRRGIVVAYLVGAVALAVAILYLPRQDVIAPLHEVQNPGAASITLIGEIAKLVMTLDAAMLAAAGALLLKGPQWARIGRLDIILTVFVFLAGAVAYFGVYICQIRILTMVSTGFLDPLELGLLWGIRLQYGGIISGVFLLGLVFARMLEGRLAGDDAHVGRDLEGAPSEEQDPAR